MTAPLTDAQRYKVLRGNAIRMLDLDRVQLAAAGQRSKSARRPWRQNSHVSSAVRRLRPSSTRRLPNQRVHDGLLHERRGPARIGHVDRLGGVGRGDELEQHARDRRHGGLDPFGVVDGELDRELHDRAAVVCAALAGRVGRVAPLVQPDRERAEPVDRIGLGLDDGDEVFGRLAHRLLEEREEQLVLAVEVLVEAAQRLLRAVDDLLDRELGRALLVDQLERGVEEALDPLFGAGPGGVQAPRDRPLPPGRLVPVVGRPRRLPFQKPTSIFETVAVPSGRTAFPGRDSPAQAPL